ncbi:MAG: hypothetical protein QG625_248 [Cyanobacteriota bacterium erpe_2018_sw_39hr_WHONDRS-SW48-000098_B_bin.30]|nr:hypothetical protein [Cyanobacteriota bacterium erpe_2018_sw_39hr_WHONDRS-SW48-000098_B_bin.30]
MIKSNNGSIALVIILGTIYLSFALYVQSNSLESGRRGPTGPLPEENQDLYKGKKVENLRLSSARVLSKEDKEQLAYLKKPIKSQPYSTFDDSLCRFTFNRVLERTADKNSPSPVIALAKSLATSTNAYDKMVLSIIACGDNNNAKDGLALCLKAVDYLDQHPQEANTPGRGLSFLIPLLYGARFAWMLDDVDEAFDLAQQAMPACRHAGDFGMADMEALFYTIQDAGQDFGEKGRADFTLYKTVSKLAQEDLASGRLEDLRSHSEDIIKSLGHLPRHSYHVLNARIIGVLMTDMTHQRLKAIDEAKDVRDRAREYGDETIIKDLDRIIDRYEHP